MGTVLLAQERKVGLAPNQVFASITANDTCPWLFNARCDALQVGEPIAFQFPTAGFLDCATIDVLGRITEFRPWSRLVIEYEAPFAGRLICSARYTPSGTQVRLVLEVSNTAVTWFLQRQGIDLSPEPEPGFRVGLLLSKSGSGSLFGAASENLARMAAEEINSQGGMNGEPVQLCFGDDGTSTGLGVAAFKRLVSDLRCSVVITNATSATFAAVQPLAIASGTLLLHTPVHEKHTDTHELVLRLGEQTDHQLARALPTLMQETGGKNFYLVGSDYIWPRSANVDARRLIAKLGGRIAGEAYEPLGTRDFSRVIEHIDTSSADIVISSFVGADEVAFERQSHDHGLHRPTLGLALDEVTLEQIGSKASAGLWSAFNYFEDVQTHDNSEFLGRYRAMHGEFSPPPSSITRSIYDTVHMVATAANECGSTSPRALAAAIRQGQGDLLSSSMASSDEMLLATSRAGKLRIHESVA